MFSTYEGIEVIRGALGIYGMGLELRWRYRFKSSIALVVLE